MEFMNHFPKVLSDTIKQYATDVVLKKSRYLFVKRVGARQKGYCTHCRKTSETAWGKDYLKHNELTNCPSCSTVCQVKSAGRGRSKMYNYDRFVWFEKSQLNPEVVVARAFGVSRDYRETYHNVETNIELIAVYTFDYGKGAEMWTAMGIGHWTKRQKIGSLGGSYSASFGLVFCKQNIEEALSGTPLQYSMWTKYDDFLRYLGLVAQYPCVEYLTKLGMGKVVYAKMFGQKTYSAIKWSAANIQDVLRLTKAEMREFRQLFSGDEFLASLATYQRLRNKGVQVTAYEAYLLRSIADRPDAWVEIIKLLETTPLSKIVRYVLKQIKKRSTQSLATYLNIFTDYKDYLNECLELGMDMTAEATLFPNDLVKAHNRTMKKIKVKRDHIANALIIRRLAELNHYEFEDETFMIRPFRNADEIFHESKMLNHCVSSYVQKYARGNIDLLVIRRKEDLEQPFYTMEIAKGKIVQCRGDRNCDMTKEVEQFVARFEATKLKSKSRRKAG